MAHTIHRPETWRDVSQRVRDGIVTRCECRWQCGAHAYRQCPEQHGFSAGALLVTPFRTGLRAKHVAWLAVCAQCSIRVHPSALSAYEPADGHVRTRPAKDGYASGGFAIMAYAFQRARE